MRVSHLACALALCGLSCAATRPQPTPPAAPVAPAAPTTLQEPAALTSMAPGPRENPAQADATAEQPAPAQRCLGPTSWPDDVDSAATPETLQQAGEERIRAHNAAEAVAILMRAHEHAPKDGAIAGDLAIALLQLSCPDDAVRMAELARSLAPTNVDIAANLAQTYQIVGRLRDAVTVYRETIARAPKDAALHNELAVLLVASGAPDEAEREARGAVKLAEGSGSEAMYLVNLGFVLYRQGRLVDAELILRRAIKLDPSLAAARNQLGVVLAAGQRTDEAISAFRKALELDPGNQAAIENLKAVDSSFDIILPSRR